MVQGPTQYTPAQILEAGQRAEADGRVEYAGQFYHHLIDHYPQTPEARIAREGVQRLAQRRAPEPAVARGGAPHFQVAPAFRDDPPTGGGPRPQHGGHRPEAPGFPHAGVNGFDRGTGAEPMRQREAAREPGPRLLHTPPAGGPMAPEPQRVQIAPAGYDQGVFEEEDDAPSPRRHYRLGRFVAVILLIVGILNVLAGVVLMVGPMAMKLNLVPGVSGIVVSAAGAGVVFLGLMFCLVAQLARAVFDGAEAARATAEWQAYAASGRGRAKP